MELVTLPSRSPARTMADRTYRALPVFGLLLLILTASCDSGSETGIPTDARYRILINGQASFSSVPGQTFQQTATLVLRPQASEPVLDNGPNPVDVGIFTDAMPIVGIAGALYVATNTKLSEVVGSSVGASAIDVAFVQVDGRTVSITMDGNAFGLPAARLATLNIYNLTTGVATAQVHHVLAGTISFTLSEDGDSVSGTIALGGSSGFGGPTVTSEYTATFSGTRE